MSSQNQLSDQRVIRVVQRPRSYVIERYSAADPSPPEYWSHKYGWVSWGRDQKHMPSFFRRLQMAQAFAQGLAFCLGVDSEVQIVREG